GCVHDHAGNNPSSYRKQSNPRAQSPIVFRKDTAPSVSSCGCARRLPQAANARRFSKSCELVADRRDSLQAVAVVAGISDPGRSSVLPSFLSPGSPIPATTLLDSEELA